MELIKAVRISMLGVYLDVFTLSELQQLIAASVEAGKRRIIANHNLHSVYLFHHDPDMRRFYREAHSTHFDGMGLIYLAQMFGYPVTPVHRVTYLDLIWPLIARCAREGWRVFYLGGRPGVAEKAAQRLRQSFPDLELKTQHGFFMRKSLENRKILQSIHSFCPDILLVGMGMPLQEQWILENLQDIDAKVILTAGACFDYLAGVVPTPPRWMGPLGLEWLFRLASEPKRLWKRYLFEPCYILGLVLKEVLK